MNICGYYPESINEGPGLRAVIFISGCIHACQGCFSKHTWSFKAGEPFDEKKQREILTDISSNPLLQGVTLCGGDPFFSAVDVVPFVKTLKSKLSHLDVWSYTGFTFEQLIADPADSKYQLLQLCDVIIDGKFVEAKRDLTLVYRGSSNQRIIDVEQSLQSGQPEPFF
ncbi:anaerobic ribonucleoside-triphosphate reductase activating protein [Paenibacillus yanchengensis]|uniref:Anaerobic ribonucleoside-triphosphate reductase-activating protein n=1 Tax=Paenibacillus yanchengensis TaxID=2035833 RepID=A0ABW4YNG1_9BACL